LPVNLHSGAAPGRRRAGRGETELAAAQRRAERAEAEAALARQLLAELHRPREGEGAGGGR